MPDNRWSVWEDLQALGVDLIVQSATGRAKKMLLADMDSTMIQQECIDELANEAGVGAHVAGITARAMNGELADKLGFDENHANTLLIEDGKLTGDVGRPILGKQAKVDALNRITAARGLEVADVMAVGDGANDLGMLHLAGTGVALHAKPSVAAECEVRINHGDLTALLYIQGIAQDDFASS
jgi:phosphoserine phosphatase